MAVAKDTHAEHADLKGLRDIILRARISSVLARQVVEQIMLCLRDKRMHTLKTSHLLSRQDQLNKSIIILKTFSTFNSATVHADEEECANAGGRLAVDEYPDSTLPVSGAIFIALCESQYASNLCAATMEVLREHNSRNNGRKKGARKNTAPIDNPLLLVDRAIDVDLGGVGWERMRKVNAVSNNEDVIAMGLRTLQGIMLFVNHIRSMWIAVAPESVPVEELVTLVELAVGRILLARDHTVIDNPKYLDVEGYDEERGCDGADEKTKRLVSGTVRKYVSPNFHADMWLMLYGMVIRRALYQRVPDLLSDSDNSAGTHIARAWAIVVENDGVVGRHTLGGIPQTVCVPTDKQMTEWAIRICSMEIANDEISKRLLNATQQTEFLPADTRLYKSNVPNADDRPAAVLEWRDGHETIERVSAVMNKSPLQVLTTTPDINGSMIAQAIVASILAYCHRVECRRPDVKLDTEYIHWGEVVETLAASDLPTNVPMMFQLHGLWFVMMEYRTMALPFLVALRVLLAVFALLELEERGPFPVIPLLKYILTSRRNEEKEKARKEQLKAETREAIG